MDYVNLHAHTQYSPMDGYSTIQEYMKRLNEIGASAMALTDHGTTAGHREFQRETKEAGIKPILGVEAYLSPTDRFDRRAKANREEADSIYNHLIILAKNDEGLKNLQAGNRIAWSEGFYMKARWDFELLKEHSNGIIVLSGCLNGVIAKALDRGDMENANYWTEAFKEVFEDDFYIELQTHNPEEINYGLLELADRYGIKPVVTDDCHHASPDDKVMQEIFLILSTHPKLNKEADMSKAQKMDLMERFDYLYPDRKMTFKDFDLYLDSYDEKRKKMDNLGFFDRDDIVENTVEVANKVADYTYIESQETLPNLVEDPNEVIKVHVQNGLRKLGLADKPDYIARAKRELDVITKKNFSNYFLVLEDVLEYARQEKIRIGLGRGSAAGSLVCYSLGITGLDPLEHNLLFERFLDEERPDWPDADIDIMDSRRGELKNYMVEKYGHVANITTVTTYQGKRALKDAARALGVEFKEITKAMKVLDGIDEITGQDPIAEFKARNKEFCVKYPDVVRIAEKLRGRINGYGMHAAGIVVANQPIANYAPIETRKPPKSDERLEVVALDMRECEAIGLIKMDFLGLKCLTVIDDTVRLIKENQGILVDVNKIPLDDPETLRMVNEGKTLGVFQCEAAPYTKLILRMGIHDFNDLVVSNALVRPGAWNAIGEDYLAFRSGTKKPKSIHPDVEEYMVETFHQPIYQEQMMRLSVDLAGFTVGESNKLRKGIGKKKRDVIDSYKPKFIEGASKKISEQLAEKLWKSFEEAGAYAFNKSHAVAYSILSAQTAWLKAHYPLEFMCALLRNETNNETITDYLLECKNMGIKIRLPHINRSEVSFSIEDGGIRVGLAGIKYISDKLAERIIANRPYKSYKEFKDLVLTKGSGLNTRVLMALNKFGGAAFEDNPIPEDYKDNLYEFVGIPAFDNKLITTRMKEQMRTLDEYSDDETFIAMAMVKSVKRKDTWCRVDMIDSTGTAGCFVDTNCDIQKGQMYIFVIGNNRILKYIPLTGDLNPDEDVILDYLRRPVLSEIPEGQYKVLAAEKRKTKAGTNMAYMTICDSEKNLQTLLVFNSVFDKARLFGKLGSVRAIQIAKTKEGTPFMKDIC